MSGLEVVGAVAAVVSAFHGGSELVAHIKKKRRRRSKEKEEFEEKQLQESLHDGETTVGQRFDQDVRELGEIVRIGDGLSPSASSSEVLIARDRLLHIAVVVQAEIIKSLQLAVQYENMVLNLKILHETSILNRQETLTTLDEMKQRIVLTRDVPRPFGALPLARPDMQRGSVATIESLQSFRTTPASSYSHIPVDYIPKAVTLPGPEDKDSRSGLVNFLRTKRYSSSSSQSSSQNRPTSSADNINYYPPALNYLIQGQGGDNHIMKDIDEIISSYQGLRLDNNQRNTLAALNAGVNNNPLSRRDTLAILNAGEGHKRDTMGLNQDAAAIQMLGRNLPSTPEESYQNPQQYPAFNQHMFDSQNNAYCQYGAPSPAQMPAPQRHDSRWSTSSSVYSDKVPPSMYSHDSRSSNDSNSRSPSIALELSATGFPAPPSAVPQRPLHLTPGQDAPSRSSSNGSSSRYSFGIPTQPPPAPVPVPTNPLAHPQSTPSIASSASASTTTINPPAPPAPPSAPHPSQFLKHTSSTNSNSTSTSAPSIKSGTIAGPHPSQSAMMSGRPCKDNNYWGFCKGAWAVREDLKRGLGVQTRPVGMHNSMQIWQCKHCTFTGKTYPGKRKKEIIINPNVYTSAVGIRYKWVFLAKSHVKRKATSASPQGTALGLGANGEQADSNYGCVICSVEGNVTGIYGNVETLMNHIYLEHAKGLQDKVAVKARFVVGRVAGVDEEWDLNCPSLGALE
ncbi:hypothetical protein BCR34DRAFT_592856 [Clohesyomyces aquaticus]|uniref:Uncharacterized protein n=1 Tax=Clohesyomyces aquaticus TaxID=1231657 RepID=A0A1Y1YNC9_9PLEO|nr:hypothetical protein BCR34DRAFT_592856 [Clohesyomyces aquaticus]